MRLTRSLVGPVVVAVVVLVVALAVAPSGTRMAMKPSGPSHSSTALTGSHVAVKIYMFAFEPANFTVKVGTTITFTNRDQTAHTATADDESFDTGTIQPGQSRSITVKKAGVFPYHCLFHEFMTGTLTVTG